MAKTSTNTKRIETWTKGRGTSQEATVVKVAVRNHLGQFHGSTNFREKR